MRCIVDDLHQDWKVANDQIRVVALRSLVNEVIAGTAKDSAVATVLREIPRLNRLRHPLIESFDGQFASEDDSATLRESISSVQDRAWWKQKFSSRWRGAATVLRPSTSGELETAWLGAAGYHRAGSSEDFYQWFERECASGSDKFLPQAEDLELVRIDRKISMLDAWKMQVHLSTLVLLANALESGAAGPLIIRRPAEELDELLEVAISADRISDDEGEVVEVIVEIQMRTHEYSNLNDLATRVVTAAIDTDSLAWIAAPIGELAMSYRALADAEMIARADEARASGVIRPDEVPGKVRLGAIAHYAPRTGLTDATIEGEPVQAICGQWFVPMHDHEQLAVCLKCAEARESLPG